jgi:hypothetical protein
MGRLSPALVILTILGLISVEAQGAKPKNLKNLLDSEALGRAHRYWDSHTSHCSDSYVARGELDDRSGGDVQQFLHVQFSLSPRQLSEADRLNGLEWDGVAFATATSKRTSHFSNFATTTETHLASPNSMTQEPGHSVPGPWSAWEPSVGPMWLLHVTKLRGQWAVWPQPSGKFLYLLYFEQWPCGDVPEK